jgi:hypothetical protein
MMTTIPRHLLKPILGLVLGFSPALAHAQGVPVADLARLTPGSTKAVNALWNENPLSLQFKTTKRVVVADLKGPAEITMMHFAYANGDVLNRNLLLRIYWDGEATPSVECPLVDFFCDPNGSREVVNTALVNVRRGFNAYFPMPFRKSARIELEYQGPVEPGDKLESMMPCYSYVCYRTLADVPADTGYFCASWKQETLKLGLTEYVALEAVGKGKFVGWNVTVRRPGNRDYPVDENEKFYIDGEKTPSIEFQGLEDSFGFSWGFPPTENMFPLTGYFPFFKGAAAYRFFVTDAISFDKSLKVAIGFGDTETGFRNAFSQYGSSLQLSSNVYWYQQEPHAPLPPMSSAPERAPAPEELNWAEKAPDAAEAAAFQARGVKLAVDCGRPVKEIAFAASGYGADMLQGTPGSGWTGEVPYARSDDHEVHVQLDVPRGNQGVLRLYILDSDNYGGGRKETIVVGGNTVGAYDNFQQGRWIEVPVGPEKTTDGKLSIQVLNNNEKANAVLSKLEWVEK